MEEKNEIKIIGIKIIVGWISCVPVLIPRHRSTETTFLSIFGPLLVF